MQNQLNWVPKPAAECFWNGAWRSTDSRQAKVLAWEGLHWVAPGGTVCSARRWRENSGVWENAGAWREVSTARRFGAVSPGGVWAEPGGDAVVLGILVWFWLTMMLCLDREMLCHERVGSWMVWHVMIWAGRFISSYSRVGIRAGRFVCSVLTLRDATCGEVRGLVDHMCWTTGR